MKNKILILVGLIFLLCLVGCSDINQENEVIKIGYTSLVYGQPSFVGDELGFFKAEGLNVEMIKFESSTQVTNALLSGNLDFVAISPCLSMLAAEEKSNRNLFKVFYYNTDSIQNPISFLIVKKGSDIKKLKDLKGKKIGIFPGNILSKISTKLLLKDIMDVDKDITIVDIAPHIQAQAIESGMIDAMFSLEPFATITLELGNSEIIHVAPQLSIMDNIPGGCGFASAKFVKERTSDAIKLKSALDKSIDYIRNNEEEAKKVFPKYTPLNNEIAQKVNQPEFVNSTQINGENLQEEYNVMVREGILNGELNAKKLLW